MNEIQAVGAETLSLAPDQIPGAKHADRPWIYSLLIAPSSVMMNGVVQGGVLAYLLSQQGVDSDMQGRLISMLSLPTSLYFLWSPITDFFIRRRTWLVAGALAAAVSMAVAFHLHSLSSTASKFLMLLSACCSQLVVSSCGGMMGTISTERARRASSGFYQAGGMGIGAVATWALIRMSSRTSPDMLGLAAAAMIALPALLVFLAPHQETIATGTFGKTMQHVWAEFRATFFRWEALPYAACMTFPMASGSAIGLLPGVAQQYGVNGDNVAWINGLLGGALLAAGAIAMGAVRYKMRAGKMYMIVALINCVTLAVLWLGPLKPSTYLVGTILYLFTEGACYAMFTAVLLEFMGRSGKSGSTRYSIINSLGNVPVLYMLRVDGHAGKHWGGRGLAGAECVIGAIGAIILLTYFMTLDRKPASLTPKT